MARLHYRDSISLPRKKRVLPKTTRYKLLACIGWACAIASWSYIWYSIGG